MWQNEEYREKMIAMHTQLWKDLAYKKRQSEARKVMWKDDSYREVQIANLNKLRNDPVNKAKRLASLKTEEFRVKKSEQIKQQWQNEEYHKYMCEKRKTQCTEHTRQLLSGASHNRFKDKNVRQALSEKIKDLYNTTDIQQNMSKAIKEKWQNKEYREKVSTARKKQWQRKDYREKRKQIMSNYWADADKKAKWLENHNKAMKSEEHRKKVAKDMLGRHWYNNGEINVFRYEKPAGEEWKEGKIYKTKK